MTSASSFDPAAEAPGPGAGSPFAVAPSLIRLVDVEPDLFAALDARAQREARAGAIAKSLVLDPGPWPEALSCRGEPERHLGLLVVEGLLLRTVSLGAQQRSELLGPGDLIRPWERDEVDASTPTEARWDVLEPTRLAVLDARFLARACRWPELVAALVGRAVRRSRCLALQLVITDVRRVEERLLLLFWHFADRWGRVRPDGVHVPVRVTHDVLAQLAGVHRPSVTSGLQGLARDGRVLRLPDRSWLLAPEPPAPPVRTTRVATAG